MVATGGASMTAAADDQQGLCPRCHLRHRSILSNSQLYLDPHDKTVAALHSRYGIGPESILAPTNRCPACLGLLQNDAGLIPVARLAQLCTPYSSPASYCLEISVPSLCLFRDHCIRAHIAAGSLLVVSVKDVLRAVLVPVICQVLPQAAPSSTSPFRIQVDLSCSKADVELSRCLAPFLSRTLPKNIGVKQLRRTSLTSAKFVDKAVSVMTPDELRAVACTADVPCAVPAEIGVGHDPVFVTGSYRKLCRRLSQTPWLQDGNDGDARIDGSVQDLIAAPILRRFGAGHRQYNFHSAGREDVDVRMLGAGRQFILEIRDPHRVPAAGDASQMQADVNDSTDRVEVDSMTVMGDAAAHFKMLEDGARTKTSSDFFSNISTSVRSRCFVGVEFAPDRL